MTRFRIRGVEAKDHKDLLLVAKHLNSVNLPENDEAVSGIIDHSVQSFLGKLPSKKAEYVFALEEIATGRIVGTSMVIGQLGRRDAPYIYFDVRSEEKYSNSLDRHFHHTVLRIGYSYDGPTEIGGIVVLPEFRMGSERLGQFLSYVRFLFIAMHRDRFREEVLAELLPPLESDGTSHLWEALGRHFTDLSYMEADKLSKKNKEFIKGLFPEGDVYASVLPVPAQKVIGEVGPQTKGVEKLLERIGFRYCERVDPFDGGPHFLANTDDITLIQDSTKGPLVEVWSGEPPAAATPRHRAVVATECKEPPFWLSVMTPFEMRGNGIVIAADAAAAINASVGDEVMILPIHPPRTKGQRDGRS